MSFFDSITNIFKKSKDKEEERFCENEERSISSLENNTTQEALVEKTAQEDKTAVYPQKNTPDNLEVRSELARTPLQPRKNLLRKEKKEEIVQEKEDDDEDWSDEMHRELLAWNLNIDKMMKDMAILTTFLEHGKWSFDSEEYLGNDKDWGFRIVGDLLEGGMGLVYPVCTNDDDSYSVYAVKTFKDEYIHTKEIIDRFKREGEIWVKLGSHPNIVQAKMILIIGKKPYIFLEYIPNGSLSDYMAEKKNGIIDLDVAIDFALQFCSGMIYATKKFQAVSDEKTFIHRDIKPSNCLLDWDMTLKISDFGLSKIFEKKIRQEINRSEETPSDQSSGGLLITKSGSFIGTIPYMSPEQFEYAESIDTRSDIYSFGVMFYQMLTGKLPFIGDNWQEFYRKHKNMSPPDPRKWNEKIPKYLVRVIDKCLMKNPRDRYQNFDEIIDDLSPLYEKFQGRAFNDPSTIGRQNVQNFNLIIDQLLDRTEPAIKRLWDFLDDECHLVIEEWKEKNRSSIENYIQVKKEEKILLNGLNRILESRDFYDGESFNNVEMNGEIEQLLYIGQKNVSKTELRRLNRLLIESIVYPGTIIKDLLSNDSKSKCIKSKIGISMNNIAKELGFKAISLYNVGNYKEALECCEQYLSLKPDDLNILSTKADCLIKLKRPSEALPCLDKLLKNKPGDIYFFFRKGQALMGLGDLELASSYFDKIISQEPEYENAWALKGKIFNEKGEFHHAIVCFTRAIDINPDNDYSWLWLGFAQMFSGQFEDALKSFDRTIELCPDNSGAFAYKGIILGNMHQYAEALTCFRNAINLGARNEEVFFRCANILQGFGEVNEAIDFYLEALKINPKSAKAYLEIGNILANGKQYEKALEYFNNALEFNQGKDIMTEVMSLNNKGCVLKEIGRFIEGIECFDKIVKIAPTNYPDAWMYKGILLWDIGKTDEARYCFKEAIRLDPELRTELSGYL